MTTAPLRPYQHSYDPGKDPEEMLDTRIGRLPRWQADALLLSETNAAVRVRNDSVAKIDEVAERERVVTSREQAADTRERISDAREASLQAAAKTLNDAVDRFGELQARADQQRAAEPQAKPPGATSDAALPGDPSEPNKQPADAEPAEPEPHSNWTKQNPQDIPENDQSEFPDPTLAHPPAAQQPVSVGLDGGGS